MPTNTLSDHACKSAKPRDKAYKLFDGHGLFLNVTPAGGKSWRMAYRLAGKPQTATFGPYPLVSLAEARVKRDDARRALLAGDSLKRAEPPKSQPTLREAAQTYWGGRQDVSDRYRTNALAALKTHVLPKLGDRQIGGITKADVLEVLNTMNDEGLFVYVRKTRLWLGQVFDWAAEQHGTGNPCHEIRPEKAFGRAKVEGFASLELRDVPAFMERLELEQLLQSAIACKLLALTWTRTKELRLMTFDQIEGDLWVIPSANMKKSLDHLVPLSRQAKALIEHMRRRSRGGRYVFVNDRDPLRPMSENSVLYLIHRMGYKGRMTGHGWRSAASTWANEAGYHEDAIERQLSHVPKNKTRAAYNRAKYLEERRELIQAWADWLLPDDETPAAGGASRP